MIRESRNNAVLFLRKEYSFMGKRSNGEGTIYKRNDGRWCAAFFDEDSNRRQYVYGKTQAEVKSKLKKAQTDKTFVYASEKGKKGKEDKFLLGNYIKDYLENYKKFELKITTYNTYQTIHFLGRKQYQLVCI